MSTVGLRELKNNLSRYVRRVERAGEVIQVTDRGKVVAELRPPFSPSDEPGLDPGLVELAKRGLVTLAKSRGKFSYPQLPKALKRGTAQELLDWTRGER